MSHLISLKCEDPEDLNHPDHIHLDAHPGRGLPVGICVDHDGMVKGSILRIDQKMYFEKEAVVLLWEKDESWFNHMII